MITRQFTFFCSFNGLLLLNLITNNAIVIVSFIIVGLIWEVSGPQYGFISGALWGLNYIIRNFAYPFPLILSVLIAFIMYSYLSKRTIHHYLKKRIRL